MPSPEEDSLLAGFGSRSRSVPFVTSEITERISCCLTGACCVAGLESALGNVPILVPPQLITFSKGITAPRCYFRVGPALPCGCSALPGVGALSRSPASSLLLAPGAFLLKTGIFFSSQFCIILQVLFNEYICLVFSSKKKPRRYI